MALATLATLVTVLAISTMGEAAGVGEAAITYAGVTPAQRQVAERTLALFAEAGLELPPINLVGRSDRSHCRGRDGIAHYEAGRARIEICTDAAGAHAEFLLLHEMAHAWDRHSLDDGRRRALMELRSIAGWRGSELEWHEKGAEQSAEIIVWGLSPRPFHAARIYGNSCEELLAGYVALTGAAPLHGHTDYC